jgi:hypothetical protein
MMANLLKRLIRTILYNIKNFVLKNNSFNGYYYKQDNLMKL